MPTTAEKIRYLSGFLTPARKQKLENVLQQRTDAITIVLEDVYYAQNISAAIRTAECFGVQNVHVIELLHGYEVNPRIVRGAAKWLDIHRYQGKQPALDCVHNLKSQGYTIYATSPDPDAVSLNEVDLFSKSAFIFGTELTGVSRSSVDLADHKVHIPMQGFTESFNISVSVALILQYARQTLIQGNINLEMSEERKQQVRFNWYRESVRHADQLLKNLEKDA